MKVRKKPVVVDAWAIEELLNLANIGAAALPDEVREAYQQGLIEFETDRITVATMEGVMTGWDSWLLIRGVKGEWYPCDQEAFNLSYEVVDLQRAVLRTEPTIRPSDLSLPHAPTGYDSNPEGD